MFENSIFPPCPGHGIITSREESLKSVDTITSPPLLARWETEAVSDVCYYWWWRTVSVFITKTRRLTRPVGIISPPQFKSQSWVRIDCSVAGIQLLQKQLDLLGRRVKFTFPSSESRRLLQVECDFLGKEFARTHTVVRMTVRLSSNHQIEGSVFGPNHF